MQKLGTRVRERIHRSAFFFGALLFHLVLALMIVGYVVFPSPPPEKTSEFGPVARQTPPPAPPPVPSNVTPAASGGPLDPGAFHSLQPSPGGGPIVTIKPGEFVDPGTAGQPGDHEPSLPAAAPVPPSASPVDLPAVKEVQEKWHRNGSPNFVIPIYLAQYADGDWDCNDYVHGGKLDSGCLPNLMAKIQDWSDGEIKGRDLQVVALDSPKILSDAPPFIFFTGHKNFHLTDAEIANLRKYLQIGGCIWGDSAFAGDGSRFDVAFHREMKRVLPDADLNFEPLPVDHAIFKGSRFVIDDLPPGMNHRADPVECINLAGKIAVLYTPNDYSDMMTMLLAPGRNESEARTDWHDHWTAAHPLFTPASFVWNADTYYRNYQPPAVMSSYKLSMNILVYLLHRYDDELLLTP